MKIRVYGTWLINSLIGLFLAVLVGCAGMNEGYSSNLPSQDTVRKRLANSSMPVEVRQQIIKLYSQDSVKRAKAAAQLGKMAEGATAAVPYLIPLLGDDTSVQISHYLGGGYYSSIDTTPGEEASHALAEIGNSARDALYLALQNKDANVRRLVAKALGQIGDLNSVDFLIRLLKDRDRGVRATAAIALGNYRHPMAAQKIMDAYATEKSPAARNDMVFALAHIDDVLAVPFLSMHAKDPDPQIRAAIMLALGKLRDAQGMPALLAGVKDQDEIVRANAAHALGAYFSPAVIEALITALGDKAARVQQAASGSLKAMTGVDYGLDQTKWRTWWRAQTRQMQ